MSHTVRSRRAIALLATAQAVLLLTVAALALTMLRELRTDPVAGGYLAAKFAMAFGLALVIGGSLGSSIVQLAAPSRADPELDALKQRVAELEARLAAA